MRSDPRYDGDTFTLADLRQAQADVTAAMLATFGDGRGQAADHFQLGGGVWGSSNGMPTLETRPSESPAWRRIIEKAKRDIEKHAAEIRVRAMAESITIEELQNDLQEIRRWANRLKRTL